MITVWVPGLPATKGSMEPEFHQVTCRCRQCANGRRGYRMVQSTRGSEQWAALVAQAVRAERLDVRPGGGPVFPRRIAVSVRLVFWLPGDPIADKAGDGDKLERNVWDALTKAGVWGDDVQVAEWSGAKYGPDPHPGVLIRVSPCGEVQDMYGARDRWWRDEAMRARGLTG